MNPHFYCVQSLRDKLRRTLFAHSFMCMCVKKTDRSKKNSVCPLRWYLYISLWRTECGGWDKTACCRRPTLSSPSSLYLTVGREKLVLSSLFQLTLERERGAAWALSSSKKKKKAHSHTHIFQLHTFFIPYACPCCWMCSCSSCPLHLDFLWTQYHCTNSHKTQLTHNTAMQII